MTFSFVSDAITWGAVAIGAVATVDTVVADDVVDVIVDDAVVVVNVAVAVVVSDGGADAIDTTVGVEAAVVDVVACSSTITPPCLSSLLSSSPVTPF